jgi:hypothetical protein
MEPTPELVELVAKQSALVPRTAMDLIAQALDRGDDLSILEKLMDLQERQEASNARRAFSNAISEAKPKIPRIVKNRKGHNDKMYADMSAYAEAVNPVLAAHGLSYRYRSNQDGGLISVTCILSHRDGCSEETTLKAGADTTGNKNSIQAIGSTITYLQRYTLSIALGLAAAEDDDGQAAGGEEKITEEQLRELRGLIEAADADVEKFCNHMKVDALPDILQKNYPRAIGALAKKTKAAAKPRKAEVVE